MPHPIPPLIPRSLANFCQRYWLALAIILLCGLLQWAGLSDTLRYDRNLVSNGEPWRWLSAHFVHLNGSHYAMNMGALGLMWLMFARRLNTLEWLLLLIGTSLLISLAIQWLQPQLYGYVGLSGTLHGVIAAGIWREWRHDKIFAASAAGLTIAKLAYEQYFGALPGSEESAGGPVIVDAHLYGAIAGASIAASLDTIYWLKKRH